MRQASAGLVIDLTSMGLARQVLAAQSPLLTDLVETAVSTLLDAVFTPDNTVLPAAAARPTNAAVNTTQSTVTAPSSRRKNVLSVLIMWHSHFSGCSTEV